MERYEIYLFWRHNKLSIKNRTSKRKRYNMIKKIKTPAEKALDNIEIAIAGIMFTLLIYCILKFPVWNILIEGLRGVKQWLGN